jgi:FHA domain-containing protein
VVVSTAPEMSLFGLADAGMAIGLGFLAAVILALTLLVLLARRGGGHAPDGRRPCRQCGRTMLPEWSKCLFCGWVPPPPRAQIDFIAGPLNGQTIQLQLDITTIGSIGGNTVVLADPAVSRKHLGIKRIGSGYELADLGSSNGVYVNGQRVPKRLLQTGDIIRIGTSEMVFRCSKVG